MKTSFFSDFVHLLTYPAFLEEWWENRIDDFLKKEGLTFTSFIKDLQELRDLFTKLRRKGFAGYAADEAKLLSYGLFFSPRTFVSIRFPMIEIINKNYFRIEKNINILDLGAGMGAGSLSAAMLLRSYSSDCRINIVAVERSLRAKAIFKDLSAELRSYLEGCDMVFLNEDLRNLGCIPDKKWDLVLLNYSLGEAFYGESEKKVFDWLTETISLLGEIGVLLIIEPALRETSMRLERLRDMIIQEGIATVYAPCLHQFPCPLLKEGRFYCHEVRKWEIPQSIVRIDISAQYWLNHLKFSFLALGRRPQGDNKNRYRLISPVVRTKGKFIATLCGWDCNKHELHIRVKDKGADIISTLSRGDELDIESPPLPILSPSHKEIKKVFSLGKPFEPQLFLDVTA